MKDSADPLEGYWWEDLDRFATANQLPINDRYGHLFFHLTDQLHKFRTACLKRAPRFCITATNITSLQDVLRGMTFDRIEVSNVVDGGYLGVDQTLRSLSGLLKRDNPHACVVALFMNAIGYVGELDNRKNRALKGLLRKAFEYLPKSAGLRDPVSAEAVNVWTAGDLFRPFEEWFFEYSVLAPWMNLAESQQDRNPFHTSAMTTLFKYPHRPMGLVGAIHSLWLSLSCMAN